MTCRASGFLFSSEAGFARATSSFTRGLGALVFVAPHYSDGIGACFQMAACATGGLIECAEYVRTQASLWSMDGPGVAKALHKQAFRERTVASIVLPAERKVGLDLFEAPPLHQAWALKATWGDKREVLYRTLKQEGWGSPSFTSNSYSGTIASLQTRGFVLEPLPNAVYCVPFQPVREGDGVAQYLTCLLGDTSIRTPPKRGSAQRADPAFEHKAGIMRAPRGLHLLPVRTGKAASETAIDVDSPGNSPVPASSHSPDVVAATAVEVLTPLQSPAQSEAITNARHGERWGTPWLKPRAAGGSIAAAVSPPPAAKRDVSRTPCGTPTRERGPLRKELATTEPAVVPAVSPSALDACVTTPSSEVAHRIGGSSAASCPPRSGGNIRDPGVRRLPSPRTRPMHATFPEGIRTVEASQPPCAKSPTDSLGLTEPKSYLPMPPHGPTPIPARPVPAVQARKESRPSRFGQRRLSASGTTKSQASRA